MPNKKLATSSVLISFLLVASAVFAIGFSYTAWNTSGANLQLAPLFIMDPNSVTINSQGVFSCITPVPPTPPTHCYTPAMIHAAYDLNPLYAQGLNGAGETIVIVDSFGSPTALKDLQTFSTEFGLPAPQLTIIREKGTPIYTGSAAQVDWAIETSLDLQWSHAIAPDAKQVLIETNTNETEGNAGFPSIFQEEQYAVDHYPGAVISQSFGATEQSFPSLPVAQTLISKYDQVYQHAIANRVTVFASAGDSGTYNCINVACTTYAPYPTVIWPSSDPLVTSAGGTWLQYGWTWNPSSPTNTSFITTPGSRTEAVWNEPYLPAATGGGLSVLFRTPSFQKGISTILLNGARGPLPSRGVPDVSWNAAVNGGVLVYLGFAGTGLSSSGWYIIGGTSAASPQLSGLIALTNQLADKDGKRHVGYLNPLLYMLPSSAFHDIVPLTFGPGKVRISNNSLYGSGVPGYTAGPSYDLASGWGSPIAANFVPDLVSELPPA